MPVADKVLYPQSFGQHLTPSLPLRRQPGTKSNVYDRLCDVSKYGASHRQRFDEHGKGRGAAGRKDLHADSGYVHGYKNQNTYQKQH